MSKLILTRYSGGLLCALMEGQQAVQLSLYPEQREYCAGDIYRGRVLKLNTNIRAAFVCLDGAKNAYLPYQEGNAPKAQQEVTVQITQEAHKSKLPSVSESITLPGRYFVLTFNQPGIHFSKKLGKREEWEAGIRVLIEDETCPDGFIVRTNAPYASKEQLMVERDALLAEAEKIRRQSEHVASYQLLHKALPEQLALLQDMPAGEPEEIITDDPGLYERLDRFLQRDLPDATSALRLYNDPVLSLEKLYSLETVLEKALARHVWLPSGGYLVIDPTEAMTVVDVNTGKADMPKKMEETLMKVNMEAADELMRQLRLRNLSGIIVADFISMKSQKAEEELMERLVDLALKDPVQTLVVDMTPLGLVEITRRAIHPTLQEQIKAVKGREKEKK
ncbi:MAG: ribonuclease E/G [Lachnospiraceae bacterium]|nr:ribonuclease E/G [Lachnospiraceae bacterium]